MADGWRGCPMNRRLAWLAVYAAAMAYVESAVVVYLRELYYPGGFAFPLAPMPLRQVSIEIGREAATIVMLVAVARLAGRDAWQWFLAFCVGFGVWDILYYAWLVVFIGWPASPLAWDVLFLIPVPWIAPVLAPLIVSVALIAGALHLLRLQTAGVHLHFPPAIWGLATAGGAIVLLSFTIDFSAALQATGPAPFRWGLFGLGIGLGVAALLIGIRQLESAPDPGAQSRRQSLG